MIEYKRILLKQSDTTGVYATVPTSSDHTDGSWLDTDIYKGELFYNRVDSILQTRDDSGIVNLNLGLLRGVVTTEGNRTFGYSDINKLIQLDGTVDRIFTVPPNSTVAFPIGTQILLSRINTAELDVLAGAGVTVQATDNYYSLNKQYSGATLVKKAINTWALFGDLKA